MSVSVARLIAQQSDAVWFTPAGAVREDIDQGSLIALEVSMEGTEEPVGMLHRSEGVPRPPALEFMKILREAATARRLAARG
jgi:DNA-binding transcriptional LysR family regulator